MLRPALVVSVVLVLALQMVVPPPPSYRLGCMAYDAGTHEDLYNATIVTWNDNWDNIVQDYELDAWKYSEYLSLFVSSLWYPEGAQLTRLSTCRGYYPIMETIQVPEYLYDVDIYEVSPPSLWRRTTDYSLSVIPGLPELVLVLQNNDPGSSFGDFGTIRDIGVTWEFTGNPSVLISAPLEVVNHAGLFFDTSYVMLEDTCNVYWQFQFPIVTNFSLGSTIQTYTCCEAVNVSLVLFDYTLGPEEFWQYPPTIATLTLAPDTVTMLSEPDIQLLPLAEDFGDFPEIWIEPKPTDTTITTIATINNEGLLLSLIVVSGGSLLLVIVLFLRLDGKIEVKG